LVKVSLSQSGGILVKCSDRTFVLDPKKPEKVDYTFVSHAHSDHLHNALEEEKIIASPETIDLAAARGYTVNKPENVEGVELLDSGHILGSRSINIEDEVIYTGDIAGRERGFMKRCKVKHSRILIIETTYGSPEYIFPSTASIVKQVNSLISSCYDKGIPVVLMGYTVGKAQLLSYLFSSWKPIFYHLSVETINKIYRERGIKLQKAPSIEGKALLSLPSGPWVLVSPVLNKKNTLLAHLKKKYNAVTVFFSGWAVNKEYGRIVGADFSFPLSDHSDFKELLQVVNEVSPDVVYTTHGYAETFSRVLKKKGFDSKPITSYQSTLHEHMLED
jgi:putative mRNA 3-end processing factor